MERVITSHDPKHPNFSYKTGLHECLMVCRRRPTGENERPSTEFVSLLRMPKNAAEAVEAADAITSGNPGKWGTRTEWPADRVAAGDWTPVQWANPRMAEIVKDLEASPALEPAGQRHRVEPGGQRIRDAYEKCEKDDDGARLIFHSIGSELRRTIHAAPESYHKPKKKKTQMAKKYWDMRSRLLVAQRFRTTVNPLVALYSDESSVGTGWVPLVVRDEREAKVLAVWWNSTPCMMMLLNRRSKTLDYPQWSLAHLKEICIPKPDNPAWDALADAYDKIRDAELLPMKRGPEDSARAIIDAAAAEVIGVSPSEIAGWCRMLAAEPSISNEYVDLP